jgi:hypothetical protein
LNYVYIYNYISDPSYTAAKKLQVNAEESSDGLANPPKVEEKLGAVPHGLSTDSEVVQRCVPSLSPMVIIIVCCVIEMILV